LAVNIAANLAREGIFRGRLLTPFPTDPAIVGHQQTLTLKPASCLPRVWPAVPSSAQEHAKRRHVWIMRRVDRLGDRPKLIARFFEDEPSVAFRLMRNTW